MHGRRLVTLALLVATFMVSLDATIITTAMPTVIGQIGGLQLYAWAFSAYLLSSTVSAPIYGKLADLYGRKPIFLLATTLFMVASILCGQAQTMQQLIAFRLLQGLGGGGILPMTQTILGDTYALAERARITGVFSSIWGISGLLGPAIGGFLTEQVSWRWVFYVNTPLCVLVLVLVGLFLHEHVDRKRRPIDYLGAILLSTSIVLLLLALQTRTPALYVGAAALVPIFVWWERRVPEPLVPLYLFRRRVIGLCTLGGLLIGVLLHGQATFVPPFVQGVLGATPTVSGFVLAATSIGWPITSTLGGRIMLRWGMRLPSVSGGVLLALGFAWLYLLSADAQLWEAAASGFVIGAGFGFTSLVFIVASQDAVGWEQRGVVTSSQQFARNIGGTVGVAVAGAILSSGVMAAAGAGVIPTDLLSPELRAMLTAADVPAVQAALAGALDSVYLVFVVIALLIIPVSLGLPGGRPESLRQRAGD